MPRPGAWHELGDDRAMSLRRHARRAQRRSTISADTCATSTSAGHIDYGGPRLTMPFTEASDARPYAHVERATCSSVDASEPVVLARLAQPTSGTRFTDPKAFIRRADPSACIPSTCSTTTSMRAASVDLASVVSGTTITGSISDGELSKLPAAHRAAARAAPHRRSHRVLLHPARRRRGDAGAGAAQPEALPRLGAQGRRRRAAGADRGRAGPRRGPRLRARLGPPGAHPRRTPPPLGGGRAGEDEGQGQGAEGRQVEGEVQGAGRARTRASLPELPEGWCWATVDQLADRSQTGRSTKCSVTVPTARDGSAVRPGRRIVQRGCIDVLELKTHSAGSQSELAKTYVCSAETCSSTTASETLGRAAVARRSSPVDVARSVS